jgi:hypothetical protein
VAYIVITFYGMNIRQRSLAVDYAIEHMRSDSSLPIPRSKLSILVLRVPSVVIIDKSIYSPNAGRLISSLY